MLLAPANPLRPASPYRRYGGNGRFQGRLPSFGRFGVEILTGMMDRTCPA
jgi:hypothetical protein